MTNIDEKTELENARLLKSEITNEVNRWLNPETYLEGTLPTTYHTSEVDRCRLEFVMRLHYILSMSKESNFKELIKRQTGNLKSQNRISEQTAKWLKKMYNPNEVGKDRTYLCLGSACGHSASAVMRALQLTDDEMRRFEARERARDDIRHHRTPKPEDICA
ncbi:hypothetical protein L6303_06040 [archaeon]|nr:hypothetical protein [Nanoarchaeota archaeon]MBU4300356.1 hypothetical protein [Nanoarchaeota archaeon]MBU4452145.1 hypothetical protein [Nanoarchaeota archaeon]MCG2724278.1 hypothetical protein [archaeon]